MELAPLAKQRFFDSNGLPLSGGKLYTYDAGTTTPKTTYSDRSGTANTNPVVLDSNGYADVWIDSGYYKFVLKDSSDNTIWTKDQISIPSEAALASAFWRDVVYVTSADSPLTLTQTHNGKLLSVDASGGAVTINLPQISLTTLPYNIGLKLTNATNTCTINRTGTDTLEGATSKVVNTTNASCQLIADIDKSPDQWAVLDFGVVDFSGYTTATPDSTDYVTIVDTSAGSINKKALYSNFKNAVYRSVTTTDSVGVDDETMKLSGASFTSTLPTAVGVAGKRYKFVHAGTSLTQVYTLATTSAQTIGGVASGSYALYTNGECLVIESDGANWQIVSHYAKTAETSAGAISVSAGSAYVFTVTSANATIGATYSNNGFIYTVSATIAAATTLNCAGTGTPATSGTLTKVSGTGDSTITFSSRTITGVPAIGTTSTNSVMWSRDGEYCNVTMRLLQTAAGTSGSGDYFFYFPTGITVDTTNVPVYTGAIAASGMATSGIGPTSGCWDSGPTHQLVQAILFTSSLFRIRRDVQFSSVGFLSSANSAFGAQNLNFTLYMRFKVSGWQP